MFCLNAWMCTLSVQYQWRASDPMKLELLMLAGHIMGSENQTWTLCKEQPMLLNTELSLQPQVIFFNDGA